jgi:hypothetical protein
VADLQLNANGLPPPGRELDAWICVTILGWERQNFPNCDNKFLLVSPHWDWNEPCDNWEIHFDEWALVPEVSTTHAFFQVMEAMSERGYEWRFTDNLSWLLTEMDRSYGDKGERVELPISHYPDRLHAYAHAVCAAAYLAEKGGQSGK